MDTKVLPIDVKSINFATKDSHLPKIFDVQTEKNLNEAANIISSSDNLVGFPTETVYGLGGSAINDNSVKNIFKAKNRPSDNPLIVHISSMDQLKRIIKANTNDKSTEIPEIYKPLIEKFWPGPVSILFPIDVDLKDTSDPYVLSKFVTNNLDTVAIRFPSDPVARSLIAFSDTPIAAPSANTSTKPSPTIASHVLHDLHGKIPLILDGGSCSIGLESTVINGLVSPPILLRPGGLSIKEIKKIAGFENLVTELNIKSDSNKPVRTPGMKYKHYSPNATVKLIINKSENVFETESFNKLYEDSKTTKLAIVSQIKINELKQTEDLILRDLGTNVEDVQFNMFRLLREMDQLSVNNIILILDGKILDDEDGLAVLNRLQKAASETIYINSKD